MDESPVKIMTSKEVPAAICGLTGPMSVVEPPKNKSAGTIIIPPPNPTRLPIVPATNPNINNKINSNSFTPFVSLNHPQSRSK